VCHTQFEMGMSPQAILEADVWKCLHRWPCLHVCVMFEHATIQDQVWTHGIWTHRDIPHPLYRKKSERIGLHTNTPFSIRGIADDVMGHISDARVFIIAWDQRDSCVHYETEAIYNVCFTNNVSPYLQLHDHVRCKHIYQVSKQHSCFELNKYIMYVTDYHIATAWSVCVCNL
jgi:hypothetical protein